MNALSHPWPAIALAVMNVSALGLWLATRRVRLVLSRTGRQTVAASFAPSVVAETAPADLDAVERRLVENIRSWREASVAPATSAGLDRWIDEVERHERRPGGGFLPAAWRKQAAPAASSPRNPRPERAH
jgi:hypothetical protein